MNNVKYNEYKKAQAASDTLIKERDERKALFMRERDDIKQTLEDQIQALRDAAREELKALRDEYDNDVTEINVRVADATKVWESAKRKAFTKANVEKILEETGVTVCGGLDGIERDYGDEYEVELEAPQGKAFGGDTHYLFVRDEYKQSLYWNIVYQITHLDDCAYGDECDVCCNHS